MLSPRIMIVEDEATLLEMLRYNFEKANYAVETVSHGDQAEVRLKEIVPDLLVLDWMLPGLSGIELCRRLRQSGAKTLPIIMLTARGEESDKVRGFETGADDYVVKPFSVNELMARVAALLRRMKPPLVAELLKVGDIELNRAAMSVLRDGRTIHLGPDGLPAAGVLHAGAEPRIYAAPSCSTACGAMTCMWTSAPSTYTSAGCAKL